VESFKCSVWKRGEIPEGIDFFKAVKRKKEKREKIIFHCIGGKGSRRINSLWAERKKMPPHYLKGEGKGVLSLSKRKRKRS